MRSAKVFTGGKLHLKSERSLGSVGVITVFLTVLLLIPFNFVSQSGGGDAGSYLSHATTLVFNGDLSYDGDVAIQPKHPYGSSLWFAAVALPFSFIDRAQDHPIASDRSDRVGSWTLFGMSFASLLAFAAGFLLLAASLRSLGVEVSNRLLWLLLVGAGIGGFWAHFNVLYAHAVEFLSVALIIYAASLNAAVRCSVRLVSFLAPLAVAFALSVRPSNVGLLLLPLAVVHLRRLRSMPAVRSRVFSLAGWLVGGLGLVAGNQAFYGQLYPTIRSTYGEELFRDAPSLAAGTNIGSANALAALEVLERPLSIGLWFGQRVPEFPSFFATAIFGSEFGWLWWTPVIVLGPIVAVLLFLRPDKQARHVPLSSRALGLFAVAVVYGVPFLVVFRWQSWASGWGYRYLLSTIPLSLVLVFVYAERQTVRRRAMVRRFLIASAVFSILSQVFFYTTAEFRPVPGAVNSFGRATNNSLPGLGIDVLRAVFSPGAWAAAFAGRSTGFLGLQVIGEARAVRLLSMAGIDGAFRYSVDEAIAIVNGLPNRIRWAYNIAILSVPMLHLRLIRGSQRGVFRSRLVRLRSSAARLLGIAGARSARTGFAE